MPKGGQDLVERGRQVVDVELLDVDEGAGRELRRVDEEERAPPAVGSRVAAGVGDGPHLGQRVLRPQDVRGPGAGDELRPGVDERRHLSEVKLARRPIEANEPALDVDPEPGEDLTAQGVPRDVVRVVLHHRRHDVVAVAKLRHQRVHDGVVGLGGVAAGDEGAAARRVDEGGDVVVRASNLRVVVFEASDRPRWTFSWSGLSSR
jgi:hypothetical protein